MGACVSVDKKSDSVTTDRLDVSSKDKRLFVASPPPPPAKEMSAASPEADVVAVGFSVQSPGSKKDIFFDSRGWLDSDCEDDFFSVNGEFTPSRGSTPNHQVHAPLTPRMDNAFFLMKFPDSKSEPPPTVKTILADFLHESLQRELAAYSSNISEDSADSKFEPVVYPINSEQESSNGTHLSGANSATSNAVTPHRDLKIQQENAPKTGGCCLPGLHSRASSETQKMSLKSCAV